MKEITVLVPCLEGAGGISVLRNLLDVLTQNKYKVTVFSMLDGKMRDVFEKMGITVYIQDDMQKSEFLNMLKEEREVFVNTLQMIQVVQSLNGCNAKIYWWIHEPPAYFELCKDIIPEDFFNHIEPNVHIYAAGHFVQRYIYKEYGYDAGVLNFGVEDTAGTYNNVNDRNKKRIRFLLPCFYFDYLKGQDILINAIISLTKEYLDRSEFFFLGYVEEDMMGLYNIIQQLEKAFGNVHYLQPVEHEELISMMSGMDCMIAPSRQDATNACIVEGMMLSKICICSDMTGVSLYLKDCVDSFVFKAEDVGELVKRIMLVISDFDNLEFIGKNGRKVYEEIFSENIFEKNVKKIFDI